VTGGSQKREIWGHNFLIFTEVGVPGNFCQNPFTIARKKLGLANQGVNLRTFLSVS
jgi:hypothetical protein